MVIAKISNIIYLADENHTVKYARDGELIHLCTEGTLDGQFKMVIAENYKEAITLLKIKVREYLTIRKMNPKDFNIQGSWDIAENNQVWARFSRTFGLGGINVGE